MRSTLVQRSVLTAAAPRSFTPATPLLCRLTHRETRLPYSGAGRPSLRPYSSATSRRPHNVIHKGTSSYIASRQLGGTRVNKFPTITGIRESSTAAMENGTSQNGTASGATKPVLFLYVFQEFPFSSPHSCQCHLTCYQRHRQLFILEE